MLQEVFPGMRPFRTADGSFTLRNEAEDLAYHSIHGAVQESSHVFLASGLEHWLRSCAERRPVDVLEVGLGTGLNMLLTWIRCLEGKCAVSYTALEPHPLDREQLVQLAYWDELAWPGLKQPYLELMSAQEGFVEAGHGFRFRQLRTTLQDLAEEEAYDVVFYDPFAPRSQPEMWTAGVFSNVRRALRPGGLLVTYCAKGAVRRAIAAAGLMPERIPGPPGKRHMLRAYR
jgi:tRNA U34 5-methylaminomethyl-2-thiouridine-forming methyltransferase MnmC